MGAHLVFAQALTQLMRHALDQSAGIDEHERGLVFADQRCKAIVGANAFAHEAGIHQDGMLKDCQTYQIMDPSELGLVMTLPLGKHSGRHAFALACADAGMALEAEELNEAFKRFKRLADERKEVTLYDVFEREAAVP